MNTHNRNKIGSIFGPKTHTPPKKKRYQGSLGCTLVKNKTKKKTKDFFVQVWRKKRLLGYCEIIPQNVRGIRQSEQWEDDRIKKLMDKTPH